MSNPRVVCRAFFELLKSPWYQVEYAHANNTSRFEPRFSAPFPNAAPNLTIARPPGVLTVPDRPLLEIASSVNKVFMIEFDLEC